MAKTGRPGLSREKRVELWERCKAGQCASDIARALARIKGAIHHVLAFNGGIAPVTRRGCPVALVLDEREEISRGIAAGRSIRRIAAGLGRSPSTISREVARHGGEARTALPRRTRAPGSQRCAPSRVVWPAIPSYDGALLRSWHWIGRPSRSLGGSSEHSLPTKACGCPTKPSIAVCLSRPAGCSRKS
jgi:DNA-binding CsgD family transcriptional regulator